MRFIRLTEAPDKDEPISVVSRRPSEVTYENFPNETKELIKQGKWVEAYRTLVNTDDIEAFIEYFIYNYWVFRNFKKNLEPIHKTLARALMSLGEKAFAIETNPLLAFLRNYFANGNTFTDEQFKQLINWWAEGIIADKDLRKEKVSDSILLNPNLYNMPNATFIVQAYYWLANKNNVSYYINLEGNKDSSKVRQDIYKIDARMKYIMNDQGRTNDGKYDFKTADYKKFRDMIIFKTPENPEGPINNASEIQARLRRLQNSSEAISKEDAEDDRSSVSVRPTRWTAEQVDSILKGGRAKLDQSSANTLVNYMKDKGLI